MFFNSEEECEEQFRMACASMVDRSLYWRMGDGRYIAVTSIAVTSMDDTHLTNTIKFIRRKAGGYADNIPIFKTMLKEAQKRNK